jgi:hypothetical protein
MEVPTMAIVKHLSFVGDWAFVQEEAHYEVGQPPLEGKYRIHPIGEMLEITAEWTAADGQNYSVVYHSIPDGEQHPYENSTVADTISTKLVDETTMDTAVFKDEVMVSYARRTLSEDGHRMTVEQQGFRPDGSSFSNRSVYVR